jgi:hypothetical protein
VRKTAGQIGKEFDAWLVARGITETQLVHEISPVISVSQSWISRIRCGRFSRLSRKTLDVLSYANIRIDDDVRSRSKEGELLLREALENAWDGSLPNAKALAGLLRSAGRLNREVQS